MKELKGIVLTAIAMLVFGGGLWAQPIDRIVAIVGDEIILESEVENQYTYYIINGEKDDGGLRCQVMDNLIVSKLLLSKAEQDSMVVADEEVQAEVERRVGYILSQMGGDESQFEGIYGKSVSQFKVDIRDDIRKEVLVDRQRSALLSSTEITPKEVKTFFKSLDKDSLGLLPAEVQLNHIVIRPSISPESEKQARELLRKLRKEVLEDGADFGDLAARYSMEPGAPRSRGSLGEFGRGQMVPEFEEVVYQLRPDEISQPFKTEFGYHIVKLEGRRGEVLTASHILLKLRPTPDGDSMAVARLNELKNQILNDSLTFEQAAIRYSEDRLTKDCGGCITNPKTGELRIPLDVLDAGLYFKIEDIKEGQISEPLELLQADGSKAWHIIYLKNKLPPHSPSLKHDYQKIQSAALQNMQAVNFENWLETAKKNIYIEIKPTECSNALKNWVE